MAISPDGVLFGATSAGGGAVFALATGALSGTPPAKQIDAIAGIP